MLRMVPLHCKYRGGLNALTGESTMWGMDAT